MMALQILLNILLSFVWMLLNNDWSFPSLFAGYVVGLVLMILLRRFFPAPLYLYKLWAFIKLLLLFLKELVLSNIAVIAQILRPKLNIRPGIFTLHTELKTDLEITLLSCLITLTPGTLTIEVSEDKSKIYIHAMNIEDAEQAAKDIKNSFEKAIMEVTR